MKTMRALVDSDEIESASLHTRRPVGRRLYTWPFIIVYAAYAVGAHAFYKNTLSSEHWALRFLNANHELYLIPLATLLIVHFLTIMSCFWSVKCDALLTCKLEPDPSKATLVCVIPKEHRGKAALLPLCVSDTEISFRFQYVKFTFEDGQFVTASYPDTLTVGDYWSSSGLSDPEAQASVFGMNEFAIPKPTFLELFREHAIAPFFVFQVFCVALWCLDEYWYYSVFTLVMLVVFESTVVHQRLRNIDEFRTMSVSPVPMYVYRQSRWMPIPSDRLLPGDICSVDFKGDAEWTVPADLILLGGASCIVNEAMISGESTPLLKEPVFDARSRTDRLSFEDGPDRAHLLFGGTKLLQSIAPTDEKSQLEKIPKPPSPDAHIIAFVARTGFGTMQGKLVRTMMCSSEHVSANNLESFAFIGILMLFGIAAATYVLIKGVEDVGRSRYKLLLECALIITAVVPPELPMELSLAVNTALMALGQFAIFCMEPFRIPLAGKLDICCFDKTGTLTSENLDVEGIAGVHGNDPERIVSEGRDCPREALLVSSTCHSLFLVRQAVAGDPMERVALDFAHARLVSNDQVKARDDSVLRIVHRFPFSSALKRMSCIVQAEKTYFVAAKGAPETMKTMFAAVPAWYERTFLSLAHDGARVLALGHRVLPQKGSVESIRALPRSQVESKLDFVGFLVFRCPLKKDSRAAVNLLKESGHRVCIITGDNALTAIYTARELGLVTKPVALVSAPDGQAVEVETVDRMQPQKLNHSVLDCAGQKRAALLDEYDVCMLGEAVDALNVSNPSLLSALLPHTAIFARASPSQKELILTSLKSAGWHTLMCGDGTNDVGALKQAHVGVALLDGRPEDLSKILREMREQAIKRQRKAVEDAQRKWRERLEGGERAGEGKSLLDAISSQMAASEEEGATKVRLGDASVAAPFTSKVSSIHAGTPLHPFILPVCSIIRQGRCTLVTTIQMYKILALNSLISAYSLSVLHLKGIRYGDFQVTITGMLLAGCFLFLSKGQPVKRMAPQRPQSNIFNAYLLTSVLCQSLLHIGTLIYVLSDAARYSTFPVAGSSMKTDGSVKFEPNLVNTAVYLLSLVTQVSTFVVNYQV